MGFIRTEEEVDALIEKLMKSKSSHITQSVTFNKQNSRHLELLKKILMSSESFGGFAREVLAEHFSESNQNKSQ